MRWVSATLWRTVTCNPWGVRGSAPAKQDLAFKRLSADLQGWQVENDVPHDRRITELTPKMLGGACEDGEDHPGGLMKLKAAQCGRLLCFGVACLDRHVGVAYRGDLIKGGQALVEYLDIVRAAGPVPTDAQCRTLTRLVVEHMLASQRACIHFVPKHHLMMHLTTRTVL